MSALDTRISELAAAAVDITKVPNREKRHEGGWWLNSELEKLYETSLFTEEQRMDFMAVVKILLDVIFADAVENPGDMVPMTMQDGKMTPYVAAAEANARDRNDPFSDA